MSRTSDHMYRVSERLSEVIDDIGVNERLVMKRRRAMLLMEKIRTLSVDDWGEKQNFNFGSQSEGSTTLGLKSDIDILITLRKFNVVQNISEWKSGVDNLMMKQHENISPGYCHLQYIRPSLPLPATVYDNEVMEHCATDRDGRLQVKNTFVTSVYTLYRKLQTNGPAVTLQEHRLPPTDTVISYCSESSPHQVTSWSLKHRERKWPNEDVQKKCRNSGCFVVPVGSKVSYEPELEWRISTSLQERYLMFSLNITQLRCYVLMKMILKIYINPHVEDALSSFMCKNVLWYCIANSSQDWHTGNLLSYLHLCLFMLKERVEQRNCPHFLVPENNLLAGHLTDKQRVKLLDIINNLMINDEQFLYEIQIDDLGRRLKMKLNMISYCPDIDPATLISHMISSDLVRVTVGAMTIYIQDVLEKIKDESIERALPHLFLELRNLELHRREGDFYRRTASELLTPLVSSTLGSVLASSNLASHTAISGQAFTYLEAGKESDALSGRLKLVSVLYCTGDMERAESELRISQKHYKLPLPDAACTCNDGFACICYAKAISYRQLYISKACDDYNEAAIKSHIPHTPIFIQCEINCVPHELRYEILKSYIKEDRQVGTLEETMWMDFIIVDPVPYLYFLKYKTYGRLQRRAEQKKALSNLSQTVYFDLFLNHRDTALNLLGQCVEQENMQIDAFRCYIRSLKHRVRNNAARFLICIQLFKLWKQHKTP